MLKYCDDSCICISLLNLRCLVWMVLFLWVVGICRSGSLCCGIDYCVNVLVIFVVLVCSVIVMLEYEGLFFGVFFCWF